MNALLETAGERLRIDCSVPWIARLISEGSAGELVQFGDTDASVLVQVESGTEPFDVRGWEMLTRGAWQRGGEVVLENVCTSGFDLHLRCTDERAEFKYRWRPPARDRAAGWILRSRFHLLARAVLMQYPALWWAGTRDRVPLHASACAAGHSTVLLTAPSGIGRSTLVFNEILGGGSATGDNLAVGDGRTVWGLVEPMRVDGSHGRRMPHGRREAEMPSRADALVPDIIVVLRRGTASDSTLVACSADMAARALTTSTYMAGELRRYWALAATLSSGTGYGPAHPPIAESATEFAARLPCFSLALGQRSGIALSQLLKTSEMPAWA